MKKVLIVAAEASSSLYAQRLLEFWQNEGMEVSAFGVGSRAMENLGFECLGRSEEMAVVGLQEVIKHYPLIRRVYYSLLAEAEKRKPDFAILLDYPDFNLRLAKDLKKRGIKVIYYISPQVWAWRTGRVNLIRQVVDHMLVLFPFEEPFYREHGVRVDFVGHPLLDELPTQASAEQQKIHRHRFGIGDDEVVVGLMPGSRKSEIEHHLKTQVEAARILARRNSKVRIVLMVAPTLERDFMRTTLGDVGFPIQVIKEDPLDMISLADVILCASGTATLMVGLMEKPMVIMYRMNPITAWLAKRLVTKTPFFGMVNLIMNRRVVPELFQEEANPERLASEIATIIENPTVREQMVTDLREIKNKLGSRGATRNVAAILNGYFKAFKAAKEPSDKPNEKTSDQPSDQPSDVPSDVPQDS
jgi:lipid-A-disaccharide synthase